MKNHMLRLGGLALGVALLATGALAQTNRVDTVSPMAPELATYGTHSIGVRTTQVTDLNRVDIVRTKDGGPTARYDRTLTLEVWYPARLRADQREGGEYKAVTREPSITATLYGKAVRDADPLTTEGAFPLVIVSHGYPGNRFLMSHLCENLASKGFVVVAIDHKESTYDDQQAFASTLYNRPFDQLFVLNAVAVLGARGSGSFLAGIVDDSRTGVVGYSMGGYGLLNVVGGGYSDASVTASGSPPNRLLAQRAASNPEYAKAGDARIRAAIAVAPWGMQAGFWDANGLSGIHTPVLFVAGSADSVAGYEKGTKAAFEGAVNANRYLLTFVNANHNAGAPIPAPVETYAYSERMKSYPFLHYADAVWDSVRMNNILDHFATAYFNLYLKGQSNMAAYLDPPASGDLKGFQPRSSVGLTLEHRPAR